MIYNDKLKIVHISPTYFEEVVGGGERYPWELTKALSKYANVTLVVFGSSRQTKRISDSFLIETYPALIFNPPLFTKTNPFPINLSYLNKINDTDIVHIHQFNTIVANIAILYSKIHHKIICVSDHNGGNFRLSDLVSKIGKFVDIYLLTTFYLYNHKFEKYQKPYSIIYGGVDIDTFKPIRIDNDNKILFVGNIYAQKGIDYLIRAIQNVDAKLLILGARKDELYVELLKSIDKNNKIAISMNVPQNRLVEEYNSSLVTVLPSVYTDCFGRKHLLSENLGLVLLESMACGTPVICTEVGGMPEIIKDGETGFIVPPNDSKSLEKKIKYFIENPEESKRMGKNARDYVIEEYTWDIVARRCLKAYYEQLGFKENY